MPFNDVFLWSKLTVNSFIMFQKISLSNNFCSFKLFIHQRILKKWFTVSTKTAQMLSTLILIRNVPFQSLTFNITLTWGRNWDHLRELYHWSRHKQWPVKEYVGIIDWPVTGRKQQTSYTVSRRVSILLQVICNVLKCQRTTRLIRDS